MVVKDLPIVDAVQADFLAHIAHDDARIRVQRLGISHGYDERV